MHNQHELREKQQLFGSLHKILTALKALAYIETHRLQEKLACQHAITERMQQAFTTLRARSELQVAQTQSPIGIVLGTERGFCGDINARLLAHCANQTTSLDTRWILVGNRLLQHVDTQQRVLPSRNIVGLAGASVTEDCEDVIDTLVDTLFEYTDINSDSERTTAGLPAIDIIYLSSTKDRVQRFSAFHDLDSHHGDTNTGEPGTTQPLLYRPAATLLRDLIPLYLFAALQSCLSEALLSENRKRLQHLDNAVHHLSEKGEALTLSANRLRQAQIIADIEVLLGVAPDNAR